MKTKLRGCWNLTPREAIGEQQPWRERVETQDRFGAIQYAAGAYLAFDLETNVALAGVIVDGYPAVDV